MSEISMNESQLAAENAKESFRAACAINKSLSSIEEENKTNMAILERIPKLEESLNALSDVLDDSSFGLDQMKDKTSQTINQLKELVSNIRSNIDRASEK